MNDDRKNDEIIVIGSNKVRNADIEISQHIYSISAHPIFLCNIYILDVQI